MNRLDKYLKNNSNSLVREELFNYRLFYDLKKAAAEREYHLKIFAATVDFEGYDIIIDDGTKIGRYQIKTRFEARTPSWNIHRGMLLPRKFNADIMNYDNGLCNQNDSGVILIDIKSNQERDIEYSLEYYYTDYYIIKAIAKKLIKRNKVTVNKANQILEKLILTKNLNTKISISKGLFVKVKNPSCLLAICGFDSKENIHIHHSLMKLFERNKINLTQIESNSNFSNYKNAFLHDIKKLIVQ